MFVFFRGVPLISGMPNTSSEEVSLYACGCKFEECTESMLSLLCSIERCHFNVMVFEISFNLSISWPMNRE